MIEGAPSQRQVSEVFDFTSVADQPLIEVDGHIYTYGDALRRCPTEESKFALFEILNGDPQDQDRQLLMEALASHITEKMRDSAQ